MVFSLRIALVTTGLLLLGACRSEPIQFHTLTPAHDVTPAQGAEIQIESISVPPQVDRPQVVIRQGDSGVAILETQWWAASLVDELRSALAGQLTSSPPRPHTSVRLDVQRFDSIPGQYALLDVKWRLRRSGAGALPLQTCRTVLQSPAGSGIDELVIAHQSNIKRLAAVINQAADHAAGGCPASQ
ncbi:PqiC family protein [Pseudomonas mucidolens]|uniref:PqiC family protein n=1 Tax=Pseudomonas mucidolens TaxID=46679 RepID=UPI0030D932E2